MKKLLFISVLFVASIINAQVLNVPSAEYPTIQSAHILLPMESFDFKHVLVPIGPDEDSHIRVCRDIAARAGYNKPAILHMKFMPGLTGDKMSASKPNTAIFLNEPEKSVRKKANKAFSGGKETVEEHRKKVVILRLTYLVYI